MELARLEEARVRVREQRHVLYERAVQAAGENSAAIFEIHAAMLDDDVLLDPVRDIITGQHHKAEYAVRQGFDNAAQILRDKEDPYLQERAADIMDIGNAIIESLLGIDTDSLQGTEPAILACEDLLPSAVIRLDKSLLLGLITREGSPDSHTAILARSMNLPALVQCQQIDDSWDGRLAVLDGDHACVYMDPPQELIDTMTERRSKGLEQQALLQELIGKASTTIDGRTIRVCANISDPSDVDVVQANDAEGVGLFRSEFLYLGSAEDPSEEAQFQAYKSVLETLAPRPVVIRTCDLGADKALHAGHSCREENPALGYRAIRICLTRRDFFKRQLRALLRASAYGNLAMMFPMITSLREVKACKEILEECRRELADEGQEVSDCIPVGIMVETPAAAICAEDLAGEVDFFSIGTNDLLQYTCAIDRTNARLEPFTDPHHPAVLRLIRMTIDAAHRQGIRCGICGELAADLSLTETFLRMGIDDLSVNAPAVLPLRQKIRSLDLRRPAGQAEITE